MKGLTISSLKGHPSLIPLFVATAVGATAAFSYVIRLATRHPDVNWFKKDIPMANLKMRPTDQYKFYSPVRDYSKERFPDERPEI